MKPQDWKEVQDALIREILAEMGHRRLNGKQLAAMAGMSQSQWSEMKDLKRPMSLRYLSAIHRAFGWQTKFSLLPE